jgi:hypothetical protein
MWFCHSARPLVIPGGKVADVQGDPGEALDLHRFPLREEPISDATLIEHLDRARVQTARTRAGELLAGGRSTTATSTPARANSPANISRAASRRSNLRRAAQGR